MKFLFSNEKHFNKYIKFYNYPGRLCAEVKGRALSRLSPGIPTGRKI